MKDSVILQDKIYISARRVHDLFGYTSDYVGQLCRSGKLESKMIGRSWFVTEKSVIEHRSIVSEIAKSKAKEKRRIGKKAYRVFVGQNLSQISLSEEKQVLDKPKLLFLPSPVLSVVPEFVHPIISVPHEFSLPLVISESFTTSPLVQIKKTSSLSSRFILTTGMLVVSFFFVFQSISLDKIILENTGDSMTSSVISASEEFLNKIIYFAKAVPKLAREVFGNKSSIAINSQNVDFNGIAVVPSTNSSVSDEILKDKIRATFSDEIAIKQDESGTAGIITPVFRKAKGDDFVYVLVPVNTQ